MSLGRRIFYNTIAQTLGKAGAIVIGLVTIAFLSRYLQESGFGQYATVIAFLGFFVVLADLGLYLYVVREISKPETNHPKILSNALGLRLVASLVALVIGAIIALLFPYDPLVKKTMFVGIGAFLFASLNQSLIGVFQKHLVQHLVVFSETVGRAVNLLLVYLFIRASLSLPFFVLALLLANAVIFSLTLKFARRYEYFGIAFDLEFWKKILAATWPLIFSVVLNLLYFKADTIILSIFHPQAVVGIYSLPYKILEGLLAFPAMFVGLIMPLLSSSAFVDWKKFQYYLQRAFDALALMATLVVVVTLFFAHEIVDLLRGEQPYLDSPALLQILILPAATIFLGTLFGYAVVAVNQQKAMIKGYLLGAIVGLILYFAFIPQFGYWGAAWGTVVTEIVVASFAYFLVKKSVGRGLSWQILGRTVPAVLLMILFFYFVSIQWLLEIGLGFFIYVLGLMLFRAIPYSFVRELLFRK